MEKKTEKELLQEVEKLKSEVEKLKSRKKYGLVWDAEKEPEKVVLDCKYNLPILIEDKKKEIKVKESDPTNILIEGDNYHSLSVLNYTHKRKIDFIYIDPPYNTGGQKEWKYNDNYVEKEDAWKHSKWISFMEKRLKLAKKLLKRTGIIFISIDDNEVAQLKLLCNEIFGEINFIEQIVWKNKYGAGAKTKGFISIHEYILCYSNGGITNIQSSLGESELKKHSKRDEKYDIRGGYRTQPLATKSLGDRPNLVYPISYKGKEIWPDKQWVWSKERMKKSIKNNEVEFTQKKDGSWGIRAKQYLKDEKGNLRKGKPLSIIEGFFTQEGTKDLFELFQKKIFDFPKPKNLIKYLIKLYLNGKDNKKAIILDFFAGSGTTAQAVLELNNEDEGFRKFILCTNNEDNNGDGLKIAEDICYQRIKKVIKGCSNIKKEKIKGFGGNLRYYKTDFVETENLDNATDQDKINLTHKTGEMIAIKEETFEEIEKDNWWQIFSGRDKLTAIYFKEDKSKLQKLIEKLDKTNKKVNLYIFSWGKNEYVNEFGEYKNIKVKDIPEPLIDVYKEVSRL